MLFCPCIPVVEKTGVVRHGIGLMLSGSVCPWPLGFPVQLRHPTNNLAL